MNDYRIFAEHGLIVIWILGEAGVADLIRTIEEIIVDPAFSPDYDVICDFSGLVVDYTSDEIRWLGDFVVNLPKGTRRSRNAIVVTRTAAFGMGRMFEMMAELTNPYEVMVVYSWVAALEWLGKDPKAIPAPGSDEWKRRSRDVRAGTTPSGGIRG